MLYQKQEIAKGKSGCNHPKLRVLMIDDHPSQIEGYKVILSYSESNLALETTPCYSCESAYSIISMPKIDTPFDVVFLDCRLPSYTEKNIRSGEDLAMLIRRHSPDSKIVIITSYAEAFLLYDIVKKINPEGLLVKSDFNADELLDAFEQIVDGKKYYSNTVNRSIKELLSKETYLDSYNRQIITLLSQGVRTRSLPDYINLSLSAIEKRKSQIRDYFCLEKGTDEEIVIEARRLGFI
jgi:two-component system response regulator NreC